MAKKYKSTEVRAAVESLGYTFRYNTFFRRIEVNDKPISKWVDAQIRTDLNDLGFSPPVYMLKHLYLSMAEENPYAPVLEDA